MYSNIELLPEEKWFEYEIPYTPYTIFWTRVKMLRKPFRATWIYHWAIKETGKQIKPLETSKSWRGMWSKVKKELCK